MSSAIDQQQAQSQPSIPQKAKKICKSVKKGGKICRKRPANGQARNQLKNAGSISKVQSFKKHFLRPDYWLSNLNQWFVSDSTKAHQCIGQQINELPILESVQQLFSLSTKKKLAAQINQNHFNRYCKVVSFTDNDRSQNVLFKGQESLGVGHIVTNRYGANVVNSMLMVTPQQSEIIEKRESFMEKLKENEQKYDASITKMTHISKDLAFTYRMYLQKRTQLCESFNSISQSLSAQQEESQNIYSKYASILIKKNLTHAFQRVSVDDPLNFFQYMQAFDCPKKKQVLEDMNQLKLYLDKKNKKRKNVNFLATACTVCLSDYNELNNPFNNCACCGMRAHQSCFSFKKAKCGYCAYQKIKRCLKEQISWCLICKQSGVLTIKFNDREYVHGFCLLAHGLWRITNAYKTSYSSLITSQKLQGNSSGTVLQSKYRNYSKSIQFINPNQIKNICSLPLIGSTIFEQNQQSQCQMQSQKSPCLGDIGVIQQSSQMKGWRNQDANYSNNCACCQQQFYKAYYLTCETCGKTYHALCAFLSGFDLKLNQNKWFSNSQKAVELNCCCQQTGQIAWSRKYKLNYKRIADNFEETRLHIQASRRKKERDELLYNY